MSQESQGDPGPIKKVGKRKHKRGLGVPGLLKYPKSKEIGNGLGGSENLEKKGFTDLGGPTERSKKTKSQVAWGGTEKRGGGRMKRLSPTPHEKKVKESKKKRRWRKKAQSCGN